jgi:hypothetical protein
LATTSEAANAPARFRATERPPTKNSYPAVSAKSTTSSCQAANTGTALADGAPTLTTTSPSLCDTSAVVTFATHRPSNPGAGTQCEGDRNRDLADRARKSIRLLRELLVTPEGTPGQLRAGVTVESFVPSGRREMIPSADTEILEACETIQTFTGRTVTIVTADLGMQLRGLAYRAPEAGLTVKLVPEMHRVDPPA